VLLQRRELLRMARCGVCGDVTSGWGWLHTGSAGHSMSWVQSGEQWALCLRVTRQCLCPWWGEALTGTASGGMPSLGRHARRRGSTVTCLAASLRLGERGKSARGSGGTREGRCPRA